MQPTLSTAMRRAMNPFRPNTKTSYMRQFKLFLAFSIKNNVPNILKSINIKPDLLLSSKTLTVRGIIDICQLIMLNIPGISMGNFSNILIKRHTIYTSNTYMTTFKSVFCSKFVLLVMPAVFVRSSTLTT